MSRIHLGRLSLVTALTLGGLSATRAASLSVYLSSPSTQSSTVAGVSTANFNALPVTASRTTVYNSPIGTYDFSSASPGAIVAADQFGGANGSRYLSLGAQSNSSAPITINLTGNNNYFGFWFSAGDTNNGISFYSDSTLLARYSTASILTLLTPNTGTVTAINGTAYNRSAYYGNPNGTNQNTGEVYSYVDIIASGITFNKVVLDNSGQTGTGFESDNHSIASGVVAPPNADVFVTTIAAVPEPSDYAVMLGGLIFCLVGGQRLLKKLRSGNLPAA